MTKLSESLFIYSLLALQFQSVIQVFERTAENDTIRNCWLVALGRV